MDTTQLLHALKRTMGDGCVGVFPSDRLPKNIQPPCGFIVNTDPSTQPGTHWIAIFFSPETVEYFDSYGQKPSTTSISKWLLDYKPYWINKKRIQGPGSSVCGHYCTYFLIQRWKGVETEDILKKFGDNMIENDAMITDWVNENFDFDTKTYDLDFVVTQICKAVL